MKLLPILLVAVTPIACPGPPPAPRPPIPDASDAAIGPQPQPTGEPCADAYAHLVALGCTPSVADASTWVAACKNDRAHGLFGLDCIDHARSTSADGKVCGVRCVR